MGECDLKNQGRKKHVRRTVDEVNKWLFVSNYFVNSKISAKRAIYEFNNLSVDKIKGIRQRFNAYDDVRISKLHGEEDIPAWQGSILADAHILAYENSIDPLVVTMCIKPICKLNEAILVK